jgi:hypothetical protein
MKQRMNEPFRLRRMKCCAKQKKVVGDSGKRGRITSYECKILLKSGIPAARNVSEGTRSSRDGLILPRACRWGSIHRRIYTGCTLMHRICRTAMHRLGARLRRNRNTHSRCRFALRLFRGEIPGRLHPFHSSRTPSALLFTANRL